MTKTLEQALSDRRRDLRNQYAYIAEIEDIADLKASRHTSENPYAHEDELDRLSRPISRFDGIRVEPSATAPRKKQKQRTDAEIQDLARAIQIQIWENRADLFPDYRSRHPVDMLDPVAGLGLLGYKVQHVGALGQMADVRKQLSNVAGLIDRASRQVFLSTGLSPATQNFTAAHELGHAAMHEFVGMHRDKPMDGPSGSADPQEREAEKFAAYFLMPEKLVRRIFEETFGKAPFTFDETTRFALSGSIPSQTWQPKTLRDLSRLLSSAPRFNGINLAPLMDQFRVSREAMAIRLEQLQLCV